MKTMTCKQLGGVCDMEFVGETFEEMAEMSRNHGKEMAEKGDAAHIAKMEEMKQLMQDPDAMNQWMDTVRKEFESLPG